MPIPYEDANGNLTGTVVRAPVARNTTTPITPGAGPTAGGGAISAAQKAAAANLAKIMKYNANVAKNQYLAAVRNYDLADQQIDQQAGVQKQQNSRKTAGERFAQLRKLQSAASGLMGAGGNALQGSQALGIASMLRGTNDLDTGESLSNLTQNQNAVENARAEARSANVIARNNAAIDTENILRGYEADYAAQLNNLNPKLFVTPGTGAANLGAAGYGNRNQTPAYRAALAGYITQAPTARPMTSTTRTGSSYFDSLLNRS